MAKGFQRFNSEKAEEQQKALEEKVGAPQDAPARIRLERGKNVLMIFPSVNESNIRPYAHTLVHFNPFHICGRAAPAEKADPKQYKEDKKFAHCPRCQGAYDMWVRHDLAGKDDRGFDPPPKKSFKSNTSNHMILVAALNVTPFFDGSGRFAKPNKALLGAWFDTFMSIVLGETEEIPEDMPEDIQEAAKAGVSKLLLGKQCGEAFRETYLDKAEAGDDPLFDPDKYLIQIEKTINPGQTIEDARGKEIQTHKYTAKIIKADGWGMTEEIFEKLAPLVPDIHEPEVEDEATLADKARGFVRLTNDEMLAYLEECKHTYEPWLRDADDEGADDEDDQPANGPDSFVDPRNAALTDLSGDLDDDEQAEFNRIRDELEGV